jgi:MarR family 2-MHQ and catechol resistance regulon transcriptional repressor
VALTRKGRKVIEAAYPRHEKNLEKLEEGLTPEERNELVRLLKKIGYHAARIEIKKQENMK